MPFRNGHTRLLDSTGRPFRFDYDAAQDRKRRRPPRVRLLSEDKHLPAGDRKKLVATTRDAIRNFAVASWALRRHLDSCASFHFQCHSPNAAANQAVEEFVADWSRAPNFDVTGRHNRDRFIRLVEARRTVDGDVGLLKLSSGHLQAIEGDRIRTPNTGQLPKTVKAEEVTHGVWHTPSGRPKGFLLCDRGKLGEGFSFSRLIPARHMLLHGYFDRFDQVRGVSLWAPALNAIGDLSETMEYAAIKAKISQLFGMAVKQEPGEDAALGDVTATTDADDNLDKSATEVDFGRGPVMFDLNPGEEIDVIESKTPATELLNFLNLAIQIILKSLDIGFSQFSENFANYSGARQALLQYEMSAEAKRNDNRELLNRLTVWRLTLALIDGELTLPKSFALRDLRFMWIGQGMGWVDPLKEAKADETAIAQRLNSRTRICKRWGADWREVMDELAAEEEYLASRGLAKAAAPAKSADEKQDDDQEDDQQEDNEEDDQDE